MTTLMPHPTRATVEDESLYTTCEGLLTYPASPLHLRRIKPGDDIYFGGGLDEDGITAACGAPVIWDNHLYSEVELDYALPKQHRIFQFCERCLATLKLG